MSISKSIVKVIGESETSQILVDDIMVFLSNISSPRNSSILTKDWIKELERTFNMYASATKTINLTQFKKMVPSSNVFSFLNDLSALKLSLGLLC